MRGEGEEGWLAPEVGGIRGERERERIRREKREPFSSLCFPS